MQRRQDGDPPFSNSPGACVQPPPPLPPRSSHAAIVGRGQAEATTSCQSRSDLMWPLTSYTADTPAATRRCCNAAVSTSCTVDDALSAIMAAVPVATKQQQQQPQQQQQQQQPQPPPPPPPQQQQQQAQWGLPGNSPLQPRPPLGFSPPARHVCASSRYSRHDDMTNT